MLDNVNKIALVTGANRGIGFEIVRQLSEQGVHAVLTGRNQDSVNTAVNALASDGLRVSGLALDVTCDNSIALAEAAISDRFGRLDILVNNAAIRIEQYGKHPSEQPLDQWHETFKTNLFGPVAVTKAFLPLIRKSSAGRIVNVTSLLASIGTHSNTASYAYSDKFKSLPAYSASKSALNSWTVHLAYELRETNIKVNSVHPGYTKTGMNDGDGDLAPSQGAKTSIDMSLIDENGPNGTFVHLGQTIPW